MKRSAFFHGFCNRHLLAEMAGQVVCMGGGSPKVVVVSLCIGKAKQRLTRNCPEDLSFNSIGPMGEQMDPIQAHFFQQEPYLV